MLVVVAVEEPEEPDQLRLMDLLEDLEDLDQVVGLEIVQLELVVEEELSRPCWSWWFCWTWRWWSRI